MRGIWGIGSGWGITAVRIAMALVFIYSGWNKYQAGIPGVTEAFTKMGIPAPGISGPFIMILELVGGILLLFGIAGRWLGLLYTIEFIVAFFYVKLPAGFGGARLDLMLLAGAILLFLAGPGKAAVDEVWLEKR
jgi:putative oxidoreductase